MTSLSDELTDTVRDNVTVALAEDLGGGDVTAALLPGDRAARARVIAREPMILAGRPWFDEVFRQIDTNVAVEWRLADGDRADADSVLCELDGPVRALLSGERTALNFLQLLSATATVTAHFVEAVGGTGTTILDTRKTIPGLRLAQKYAVRCGGGNNHRIGLFDAILIKENHIAAAGSIAAAIAAARTLHPDLPVEVEVETIEQLREALAAKVERVMLDNFTLDELRKAVAVNRASEPCAKLESSGGVTMERIRAVAETGVDYVSVGALTKNVRAADLSMRISAGTPGAQANV